MRKSNLLLIMIFCLCLCLVGCSKEDNIVSGAFGTGVSESSITESITESSEDKFAIKDEVILSTEDNIVESSETENSLNNFEQSKVYEIEQNLKSKNLEVTKEEVLDLLNTDDFVNIADSDKDSLATKITDKVNNSISSSNKIDSDLVYKYAVSYETDEVILDEEATSRTYSEEELESMHSEAEKLYQQQQISETFEFDD